MNKRTERGSGGTRALRIEYKEAQADRGLPALRQLAYRPALEAIRAAVDGPFMKDRAMTRRVEVSMAAPHAAQAQRNRRRIRGGGVSGHACKQAGCGGDETEVQMWTWPPGKFRIVDNSRSGPLPVRIHVFHGTQPIIIGLT
ncbi:MAG: hypothetical protein ABSG91_23505 [Syntrophobacteraceae bacterium]